MLFARPPGEVWRAFLFPKCKENDSLKNNLKIIDSRYLQVSMIDYLCIIKQRSNNAALKNKKSCTMNVVKTVTAAAANSDQSLQSLFDDIYPELFTDKCENVKFLLYFDLDKNAFAFKDDEAGQYRQAFEQQNNVVTIGYVDANSALTRSLEEIVEHWAQSNF